MTTTCRWQLGLALFALCAGSTCGSSKQLGDTGLPEGTALPALSADDWQIFCKAFDAARRKNPEEECRRLAFAETRGVASNDGSDAEVQATCKSRYDSCVHDIRPPARGSGICGFGPVGPDCMATVGESEQCLMAMVARRKEIAATIPSCDTVTAAQANATAGTIGPGEAELLALPPCETFNQKCPGLLR